MGPGARGAAVRHPKMAILSVVRPADWTPIGVVTR